MRGEPPADGTVQTSYDALRNATNYGYDDAGRRTSVTDAMNKLTTFGYDNVGNQTSVLDANQHQTQFVYDKLGRKTQTVYPDQTTDTTHYDSLGRVDYKLDQAGVRMDYGYDGDGRLTSVTQYLNFGQANQQALVTQYGYDEVGNRISQTDANQHTTKYVYDQLGRRVSRMLPAGQSESYSYDAVGNLQQKIDFNGKTTTYAYDSNNRLQSKTPDPSFSAQPVSFTYYNNGLRKTMVDPSGTTSYVYDNRNRLQTKQTPEGTLNYTYDNAGDLLTLASGNANGASDTYTYDALNRLSTVVDASGTTTYAYDNVGNLQSFAYPNGVTTAYTYDSLNRLKQMGAGKNGTLQANYVYTLGAAGNRLTVAELSGRTVNYGYDSLYRLTSEAITNDPNNHNNTTQYQYDNVGNRQQLIVNGTTANVYSYDADDRLGSDQYDPNGNTVSSAGTTSTYDFENHLVSKGGVTIVYDGDGNRVSETVAGVTTTYLVDTQNPTGYAQVVDEIQNGSVVRTYSWGLELISKLETGNSKRSFYGFDGHGSVRFLTDSNGTVTDTYDYDAFGNLIASTGSTPNNYLFAGEQYDPALGFYYNRARYYNNATGRFWSVDAYEGDSQQPLSLHKYVYGYSDPVDNVDHCGYCLPSNAVWGKIVQDDIFEQYFEFTNEQGRNSPTIAELVAPSAADYEGGGLKPDLATKNSYWGEFYEIKSIYSLAAAELKIATYTYYLNKYDKHRVWIPGLTFVPKLYTPIDGHTMAIVVNTGPGSISYCVVSTEELVSMAVILLEIAGMMALAGKPMPDPGKLPPLPVPVHALAPTIIMATQAVFDVEVVGAYFY